MAAWHGVFALITTNFLIESYRAGEICMKDNVRSTQLHHSKGGFNWLPGSWLWFFIHTAAEQCVHIAAMQIDRPKFSTIFNNLSFWNFQKRGEALILECPGGYYWRVVVVLSYSIEKFNRKTLSICTQFTFYVHISVCVWDMYIWDDASLYVYSWLLPWKFHKLSNYK